MPVFEVTGPDGSVFEIDAPEGASEAQVMAFARSRFNSMAKTQDIRPAGKRAMEGMSAMDRLLVGVGRGATDVGQGLTQLFKHVAANPLNPINSGVRLGTGDTGALQATLEGERDAYDAKIRQDAVSFDEGVGDTLAGKVGRIGGNLIATAPTLGAGGAPATLGAAARIGALQGAVGGSVQPATGDGDFLQQKLVQTGTGAGLGALGGTAGYGLVRGAQAALNAPRKLVNQVTAPQAAADPNAAVAAVKRAMTGSPAAIRRGERVAKSTGIDLTPGQMSGGRASTMAENMARQSIFTADKMLKGDMQRARQMVNAVQRTASKITPSRASAEDVASRLQGMTKNMVTDLANRRSEWGRAAYGRIDRAAGGAPVVDTKNTLNAIASIVDEYKGIQGADASKFAQQAEAFFNALPGDGKVTASTALKQLQAWEKAARTGQGLFEGIQDRSAAKVAAGKLAKAIQADLEAVEGVGGSLGEMLREANKGWRLYTKEMETIEASALGRIVGEDFVDEAGGVAFNKLAPEQVWGRLDKLTPTELGVVKGYVTRTDPELWRQYQRTTLERALAAAQTSAPSAGNRTLAINPGAFVKALEGSSGEKAVNMMKRLESIYGDTPQWKDIRMLLDAGRRMADSTGKNFSGTGPYNEAMGAWQRLTAGTGNLVERVIGTAAGPLGLNRVANVASAPMGARAPLPLADLTGSRGAAVLRGLVGPVSGSAAGSLTRPESRPRR